MNDMLFYLAYGMVLIRFLVIVINLFKKKGLACCYEK